MTAGEKLLRALRILLGSSLGDLVLYVLLAVGAWLFFYVFFRRAAYAFSPAEALVQAGIGPLIVFTIPVHPAAFPHS